MTQHPYQEAIEMLKLMGADHMHAYEVYRNSGHHILAQDAYNRGVAFNCAAQFLREGSPGGLAGPTPPRPAASSLTGPVSHTAGTPSRPETSGTSATPPG